MAEMITREKKPFKGEIHNWGEIFFNKEEYPEFKDTLGFVIFGTPSGHPSFTNWLRTSPVVKFDETTGEIETLNSRYLLKNAKTPS